MFAPSTSRRPLAAVVAAGLALSFAFGAALVTSVISAAPASAHAALIKITPDADARLTTAPAQVVLEFDEPISTTFATVVVTTAAGVNVARGRPTVLGGKVTQALSPDLASGNYRVAYRVVSNDGHPVSGESTFTLALAPGTSPATSAGAPSATSASSSSAPSSTTSTASVSPSPATPSVAVAAAPPAEGTQVGQGDRPTRSLAPIAGAVGLLVIGAGVLLWKSQRG